MPEFAATLDLSTLDGTNGFVLEGIDAIDRSGQPVASAGDINGDGFDDVIVGAQRGDPGGNYNAGESYVVFGQASGFAAAIDLSALDGTDGFRIDGIDDYDYSARSVASAGDVNGDGFDDIIVGAANADPGGVSNAGETYVVFGTDAGFAATFDLSTLDGTNGFRLDGIDIDDVSGFSAASAGDVNGDGFDDIIVSAYEGDPGGDAGAGETYVVFGTDQAFAAAISFADLDGSNGFRLDGIDAGDLSGRSVASAGDINGDGFDDIIIGADRADPGGDAYAGESYVVFGKGTPFAAVIDLSILTGTDGFRLDGIETGDYAGFSVASAGDVNADGFDDIVIGAFGADPGGESYVVFGTSSGFGASFDLSTLDGTNGFRIDGIDATDFCGVSVAGAGDVNGDGFADLLIAAELGDPGGDSNAGESYVVFGRESGFSASFDPSTLDGDNGFRLDGIDVSDYSGVSVAGAGDVNGDGFADLVIGAFYADPGGDDRAGESYVVFGHEALVAVTRTGTAIANTINGGVGNDAVSGLDGDDTLNGRGGNDNIDGGLGSDDIFGGGGHDSMNGGAGSDDLSGDSGNDRVVASFGSDSFDGGAGKDTIDFRPLAGSVTIDLAAGTYTLSPSLDSGTLTGVEQVIGTNGADTITGKIGNDIIQAAKGNDTVDGAGGNDFIAGNYGSDLLTGGLGHDTFDYNALSESSTNPALRDTITDFKVSGSDKIDVSTLDADATLGGNQSFSFLTTLGAAFTAAGQVRFSQSGGDTFVDVNTDANLATIEMQIQLTGLKTLAATDFVL